MVNTETCANTVRVLSSAFASYKPRQHPILLLDAPKPHLNSRALSAFASSHILPVLVLAKTTWLLQLLDTHAFASYKVHVQKAFQEVRILTPDGAVGVAELLESACAVIRNVREARSWFSAFSHNFFQACQVGVSGKVLASMRVAEPLVIPSTRPTDSDLQQCFASRARMLSAMI